jgi:hypothetical protein
MNTAEQRGNWRIQIAVGVLLFLVVLAIGIYAITHDGHPSRTAGAQTTTPTTTVTAGTVPQSAFTPGGGVDLSQVPDFISALGPNGQVVGYIPKSQMFPAPASPSSQANTAPSASSGPTPNPTAADMAASNAKLIYTVYGSDLKTVVGHIYPGVGFVPVGQAPPAASTTVTTITTPPNSSPGQFVPGG